MLNKTFKRIQFAQDVDEANKVVESTQKYGGATMDAVTGKMLPVGTPATVIGGAPNAITGEPVATARLYTQSEDPSEHLTTMDVLTHRDRIRRETGMNPTVTVGTWNPSPEDIEGALPKDITGVNIDAGTLHYTDEDVDAAFKARPQEVAGTNLRDLETVPNKYYVAPDESEKEE